MDGLGLLPVLKDRGLHSCGRVDLDYPFLRARGAWNPWGYYLDILFVLGVGASTLLLVLEDLSRGLGALSALSGELQRHRSKQNEDVFAPLLARTITLTGVRGSAIYLGTEEGGSFVAAVGACEGWEGSQPSGPAAEAIGRVLKTGRPEAEGNWKHTRSDGTEHPYAAALPILQGPRISGALVIVGDARDPFAALDEPFLEALGQQVGAALEHADLYRRLEQRREELERLAQAMVNQHEEERRRLSRELHDETAQVFAAVKLELGVARESSPPELVPRMDRALALIDTGMRSIRNVTSRLRPSLIDDVGLLPALRALTNDFHGRDLIQVKFDAPDALPSLSEHVELALFRGVQEGLANAVRHAQARSVTVSIEVGDKSVGLRIRDDGQGLPSDWSLEQFEGRGHMGLAGMRERVNALGGEFSISSAPNGGVDLSLTLPNLPAST
jgi:signal transduction histidine kinase